MVNVNKRTPTPRRDASVRAGGWAAPLGQQPRPHRDQLHLMYYPEDDDAICLLQQPPPPTPYHHKQPEHTTHSQGHFYHSFVFELRARSPNTLQKTNHTKPWLTPTPAQPMQKQCSHCGGSTHDDRDGQKQMMNGRRLNSYSPDGRCGRG